MDEPRRAHHCHLTRTNLGRVMFYCDCGESGPSRVAVRKLTTTGKPGPRDWQLAEQLALDDYRAHVKRSGPMTATLDPVTNVGVVMNFKRFGHA